MRKLKLSSREEQILLLLKNFDFLTRDQLNQYFKLGTKSNTNKVLNRLSDYLFCIRDGYQSIYYLNKEGREYVECDKIRKKTNQVQHIVMRNQFWLFCKCPRDWRNEVKLVSNGKVLIVSDAAFSLDGFKCYLEVDNLQTMKENREKIERYKEVSKGYFKQFMYYPTIIWLTTTEHRRKQLERACEGLKVKIYTVDDIQ